MGRAWPPIRWRHLEIALLVGSLVLATLILPGSADPTRDGPRESAPDLAPANATMDPPTVHEDDVLRVSVRVVNRGGATAVAATIDLIDARPNGDVIPIGQTALPAPLAPGASVIVETPPFFAVGVGPHTLTIVVGNVTPAETNGGDDSLSIPVMVRAPSVLPPPASDGVRIEGLRGSDIATLLVAAGAVCLFVATIVVLRRPRLESVPLEPPPPEPPDRSPPPIWPP